jgi:acetylglutamate kinase
MKMPFSSYDRAEVLVEALPYIQQYYNKTVVVKYGGNAMINPELKKAVITDIVLLSLVGIRVVIVHGGGPEIDQMLRKIGKTSTFVNGLRYTDEETMDVVRMVLAGNINKDLVLLISRAGGAALGLCGIDGGLIKARKLVEEGVDYGLVGKVVSVDPKPIFAALEHGYIPVISSVAEGIDANTSYNINADTAASEIAIAMKAEKLVLLTDVRGLLRDQKDDSSLITSVKTDEIGPLIEQGVISGGMIPKVECCVRAIRNGVKRTHILDGRIPHSILIEMLSDAGIGTMIY